MTLLEVWEEMERQVPRDRDGRLVRRVHPESQLDLFLGLQVGGRGELTRRTLELHVAQSVAVDVDAPVGTRMVQLAIERREGERIALVLALEDPGAYELFASLGTDILRAVSTAPSERLAVNAWVGRFAKWRRMLQEGWGGLSAQRQRGLFGELMVLREVLIPAVGFDEAVRAWTGPDGSPRDVELRGVGIEVKTSAANEPQVVPIHGERQLDDAGLRALTLVHLSLEALRDVGESLPSMVASLREHGADRSEAGLFEDRLLQSGYVEDHPRLDRRTGYVVRRTRHFRPSAGFPRIVESDLRDGVGSVTYRLAIDACGEFEVPESELAELLRGA